jgi:hypothetical protein
MLDIPDLSDIYGCGVVKKRPDLVRTLLELSANPFAYDR